MNDGRVLGIPNGRKGPVTAAHDGGPPELDIQVS